MRCLLFVHYANVRNQIIMLFFASCWTYTYWLLRPLFKWFLRKTTRLCELERICYGEPPGAKRALRVEFSLTHSKTIMFQETIKLFDQFCSQKRFIKECHDLAELAVHTVMEVKHIHPCIYPSLIQSLGGSICMIWGYRELLHVIEDLRVTAYDSSNAYHEDNLLTLWKLLMPSTPLEGRVTKQWQDIGFQGDDPKTDFRGMGILGLLNLVQFATTYPSAATHVLSHAQHPQYGYDFAIVGINITSMAYHLVKDGTAKTQMYNLCKGAVTLNHFHHLYSYLFYEFDKYWMQCKPPSMMAFNTICSQFENSIRNALANPSTVFKVNVPVDVI